MLNADSEGTTTSRKRGTKRAKEPENGSETKKTGKGLRQNHTQTELSVTKTSEKCVYNAILSGVVPKSKRRR